MVEQVGTKIQIIRGLSRTVVELQKRVCDFEAQLKSLAATEELSKSRRFEDRETVISETTVSVPTQMGVRVEGMQLSIDNIAEETAEAMEALEALETCRQGQ